MGPMSTRSDRTERAGASLGTYIAPTDRLITLPFTIVTVSTFAFFMYVGTLLPLIPLYIEGPLGQDEFGVGLNVAAFAIAAVLARPMIGSLANRFGRRVVIVAGALIAALGGVGMSQVESLIPLLGFRMLTGIGEAAVFVGAATLIADMSPRDRRAESASYFSVAIFTGLGVGPVFGEWFLDDTHFERAFIAASGFALISGVVGLFAPARVVSPDSQNGGSFDEADASEQVGLRRLFHPAALLPGVVLALGVGGITTFFLFVPQYSRDLGMSSSSGLFLVYAVVSLVIRVFGATLPERLGPRHTVTIALSAIGIGLVAVAVIAEVWAVWFAAFLIGIGAAFHYPSLNALAVNRVGDRERAVVISSFTMFFEIGSAISGLAVGRLAEGVGKQHAFYGGVVMVVVGLYVLRTLLVPASSPEARGLALSRPVERRDDLADVGCAPSVD
jgi:MFS family permease